MMSVYGAVTRQTRRRVELQVAVEDGCVQLRSLAPTHAASGAWAVMSPAITRELADLLTRAADEAERAE